MRRSLTGIERLYLDSNILIYLVEGHADLGALVLEAFKDIEVHRVALYTSEFTITECLRGAYQMGSEVLAQEYLDLLGTEDFITMLPIDSDVCMEAARLGALYHLKTADSLHVATATLAGCNAFLTNDSGISSTKDLEAIQLNTFALT